MLRSSINTSRLLMARPFIRPSNPPQILSCIRQQTALSPIGSRCMAVAANANPTDAPMITPGTPVSTPTLIEIDKRWLDLNAQQQLDIFKALHEREKEPWYTMTTEERKACTSPFRLPRCLECVAPKFWRRIVSFCNGFKMDWLMGLVYYINFGPHGPRAQRRKDGWEILGGVATCLAVSFTIFWLIRQYRTLLNLLPGSFLTLGSHPSPSPNHDSRVAGGDQPTIQRIGHRTHHWSRK